MGGKPLEAMALVALGYRGLSMSPASIGPVKAAIMAMDLAKTQKYVNELISRTDGAHSLRDELMTFAESHGIPISEHDPGKLQTFWTKIMRYSRVRSAIPIRAEIIKPNVNAATR